MKTKIILPIVIVSLGVIAKLIFWNFAVSSGRRTGNLVKMSKKGKIIKTWEGTLDLGSGDKLTFDFSVKDEKLANEMYNYEGRTVSIFYEEHLLGWPRETKYNVVKWNAKKGSIDTSPHSGNEIEVGGGAAPTEAMSLLEKTLFCSTLGSLYKDQELYQKVKTHLKENNLYLYRQIQKCNE